MAARSRSRSPTLRASRDDGMMSEKKRVDEREDVPDVERGQSRPSWKERRASGKQSGQDMNDPFGDEGEGDGVKYRTMKWWQTSALMIAETISLGILSLPSALKTIGMVPGAILILGLGIIATYTGYVIGQFKQRHPWVHNMADCGYVLFKPLGHKWARFGKEFLGLAQIVLLIFSMASHLLTWMICINTLTSHATCTIVWGIIGLAIFWVLTLPRTLQRVSWMACVSFVSITTAVLITMIAVGINQPGGHRYANTKTTSFAKAFASVTNIIFAYIGHVAFFSFISEMEKPEDFPKALVTLQVFDTTMYLIAAVVIYAYAGDVVVSPALGSTTPIISKIAYGLAIPTILIAGVILGHVCAKLIYVRLFRGTKHMADRGLTSLGSWAWMAITLTLWTIAWIIAESIPNFNTLLALISSLFGSWFTYGLSGILWLFIMWEGSFKNVWFKNWKKTSLTVVNLLLVAMGAVICVAGLYASITELQTSEKGSVWTCAAISE